MTARKKSGAKKVAGKRTGARKKSALARIEDELPANLRDYAKQVHKRLNALERDLERAIPAARRRTARVIRDASHQLGVLEERGQRAWKQQADSMTRDAQQLLRRLEKAVAPERVAKNAKKTKGKKGKKGKKGTKPRAAKSAAARSGAATKSRPAAGTVAAARVGDASQPSAAVRSVTPPQQAPALPVAIPRTGAVTSHG